MKVLKFGGTSVGSAQCMKDVAKLICDGNRKIVVLSAMAGTTNTLVEISDYLYKKNTDGARETIGNLERKYNKVIDELYSTDEYQQKTLEVIKGCFDHIRSFTKDLFTLFEEKVIVDSINSTYWVLDNYYLLSVGAYTDEDDKFLKEIKKVFSGNFIFDKELFDLYCKQCKMNISIRPDSLSSMILPFIDNIVSFEYEYFDTVNDINDFSLKELEDYMNSFDFSNYTVIKIVNND